MSKTLDEILAKHDGYTIDEYMGKTGSHNYSRNDYALEARQAILQWVADEVIRDGIIDSPHNMNAHTEREIQRIEQRQILRDNGWRRSSMAAISDEDLRKELERLYNESRQLGMLRTGSPINHMVDGALSLIASHDREIERLVRIAELESLDHEPQMWGDWQQVIEDRIKALEGERE